ncbi:alcohol dehydrogenase-like 1 isoform X2 [Morus notabilis]|uniref:alcohol dehydrogenase-like 1 isoform X2 n=1 Tax=Morus notabilis TaxID=981085 RepID=UPI000CED597A|nr:alcohol dehydrogenase-like 1 isoform X2 [Morus notabilis]
MSPSGKSMHMVESAGENVEEVKEGDIVVPVFLPNCKECRDCKSKKSNNCSVFKYNKYSLNMPRDQSSRFRDMKGEVVHHFFSVSSFAQYTVVDVANVVKISQDLPLDKACLLSCGVSTGVGAAWKVAEVEEGSTVAIFGLGSVGLAVAEGAKLRGASKIIGVDLNPKKFEIGKNFGVTDYVNPATIDGKSVSEVIKDLTDGGADYCFECIGLASLMQDAFSSCREGWGQTVILGMEMHGSPLSVNSYEILRGKTVTGSMLGGVKPKIDIPILARKYLDKELNLDGFITHELSFRDINKAFDLLLEGDSLRSIIWMDK